ncbi:MAG: glycerate kinase [Candidatus Tectomicrobia bacterium]|nr:glycerate kinase [Candidatus Tectomicrobia bacterium]
MRPTTKRRPAKPSSLRRDARAIFEAGLAAVRADEAVRRALRVEVTARGEVLACGRSRLPLRPGGRIIVVGAGKASARMARAAEGVLGRRIAGGCVVTSYGSAVLCRRVEIREAGHPAPDAAGAEAARRVGRWVDEAGRDDLVLCLISGGGSSLLPAPAEGLTLQDKRKVTAALLRRGAPIEALNCVRKHLSALKGGQLARRAAPARVLVLLISDVVGDPLDVIASGPACGDPTTFADARACLERYGAWRSAPARVRWRIEAGMAGRLPETPSPADLPTARVRHELLATNDLALRAAAKRARALGYRPLILTRRLQGEAREAGAFLAALAGEIRADGRPLRPPACLLLGGETTVTVRGRGLGGRCQELALSFAIHAGEGTNACLLAAGTDGRDGPTPAAGAFGDGLVIQKANALKIDPRIYLSNNDAFRFFRRTGALFRTGPTGTNLMDLMVLLER